jgi:hypothetical protein
MGKTRKKPEDKHRNHTLTKLKQTDIRSSKENSFNTNIKSLISSGDYLRRITTPTNEYLIVNSNGKLLNYQIDKIYCLNLSGSGNIKNLRSSITPSFGINVYCKIDGMIGYEFLNGTLENTGLTEYKGKHVFVLQIINCDIIMESKDPRNPNAEVERRIIGMGLDIFENPDDYDIHGIQFTDNENRIKKIGDIQLSLIKIALYYGNFHEQYISSEIEDMFNNPSSQNEKTCLVEDDNSPFGLTTSCQISGGYKHRKSKKYKKSRKTNKRKKNKK